MLSANTATLRNRAASVLPGLATKLKARKHLAACLATGACALATALPANATLTFDFSFELTSGSPDNTGTVTGTITGLQDNTANQTAGLIASNLSAPNTPFGGWPASLDFSQGTGISVANGIVTDYSIRFRPSNLPQGGDIVLRLSNGASSLTFFDPNTNPVTDVANESALPVTFSPQSGPTPVPGPLPLLGAGAAFGWSRKLRRRVSASTFRL